MDPSVLIRQVDVPTVPAPAPVDDLGELSLRVLFRLAAAGALLATMMSLTGCGGGGDAAPAPPSPAPPAPAPASSALIPAQLSVPTPVGYDADRLAAFNRLNEIRLSAGLGMLAQNAAMDQAAQAHAAWMVANNSFTHEEVAGTPGFTGAHWWNRDEALGYVPMGGMEVMTQVVRGAAGVDALINTVYHRAGMLAFEPVDVGIGWSIGTATSVSMPLVIDITRPGTDVVRGMGQAPQTSINGVSIWPLDGAHDVPRALGLENPNPVPNQDVLSLGAPVSLEVEETSTISVLGFTLINATTGAAVPTMTLTQQNDPNGLIVRSFVAAVPLAVLAPGTTYKVAFSGSALAFGSGTPVAIQKAWSFTTAAR